MRRRAHTIIGSIAFLAYTYPLYLSLKIPTDTMLLGFFAMASGSVMPDVLDPPTRWTHRGLAHSRRALRFSGVAFVVTAFLGLFQIVAPDLSLSYIFSGFFLGYAVHLLADAMTPAGLPG